ncbi:MAG: sulfotransferase [Actinomycetota bacterium]|nr:sulfotransferase [Actinomycetota bacterium]
MIPAPETLVERACAATGLRDLGPDGWQEGLDRLVRAATSDLALDDPSAARLCATIHHRLTSRLRIEDWYADQAGEVPPIGAMVVIHGLPRTATTALQYLLACGPDFRFQRRWEISDPIPPPESGTDADDPRRLAAKARREVGAGGSVQHISDTDGPVDDNTILGLDFHNQELGLPLPSYTRWWRSSSLATTYAYHERVLRLLQTGRPPRRWLVKAPYHNFHLSDLAAHYPEARFIMAHRDPAAAFPSACSTVLTAQCNALPDQPPDPLDLGAFLLEHLVAGIERAMADRAVIGEHRFLDVTQKEMEADPLATADRIYEFLGLDLVPATRRAMADWAAGNRRGARGPHRYTAETYGFRPAQIRSAFRHYIDRFGIEMEDRARATPGVL